MESFRAVLHSDHQYLDKLFQSLIMRARTGEPGELRAAWSRFEQELGWHMQLEEAEMLPTFARAHPAEAEAIREEHRQIREQVTAMGLDLDLHCLRAERVEALVALLRDHARREEALLYPWSDDELEGRERESLRGALERLMIWRLRPFARHGKG
jgi:hemerythrin superfamily protein